MKKIRLAKTKSGRIVQLGVLTEVEGGWTSWVMFNSPSAIYAVNVFIPGSDR